MLKFCPEIKFEGSVVINDPSNYNSTSDKVLGNTPVRRSPGVYIGDTRAFSSDNNPWDKVGTALTTSSEEVSIGELAFLDGTNSMIITGIDNDVSTVYGEESLNRSTLEIDDLYLESQTRAYSDLVVPTGISYPVIVTDIGGDVSVGGQHN